MNTNFEDLLDVKESKVNETSSPHFLGELAPSPEKALSGIRKVVADVVEEMTASGESVPEALSEKKYSGRFMVRIPAMVHRTLATEAAEQGVSINRLVSAK